MDEKVSVASCSGMSPNGLIARVSCDDLSKKESNISSLCMGSVSAERDGYFQFITKYPIISVNGCGNTCVNKIMKQKRIEVKRTVIVKKELEKNNLKATDTSRLDENGEECVRVVCDAIKDTINKIK
ncbi:putative zinc-binding protein [Methanosphaera sp.]